MNKKRIEGTPYGGYSEIYFFDDNGNSAERAEATNCVVRECRADGTLIREIWCEIDDTDDDTDYIDDDIDEDNLDK